MDKDEDPSYKWACLMIIIIGTFMAFLDSSIVNIALSKIMSVFGTSLDTAKWVITGYMLTSGAIIPLTGYLEEVYGFKKIYIFALTLFTIGSFLCGISWNINALIVSRIIQAIGGGMIMPVGMSMLYKVIPKESIGLAGGIYGIALTAAPAIGPTLGGYIVEYLNWNLIFNINIPIGIIGVILAVIVLKDEGEKNYKKLDFIGVITSTFGVVSLLYVISKWSDIDWNNIEYPLLIVFGSFNMLIFIFNELTVDDPLIDLSVLKILSFSTSTILINIVVFGMYGVLVFVPLYLQNLAGFSPVQAGLMMLSYALGSATAMPIAGKLSDKIGGKPFIIIGMFLMIISSYELHFLNADMSNSTLKLWLYIRGVSVGMCMMPANTMGMIEVPKELLGKASALQNTVKQISGSLSTTILTVFMQNRQNLIYYRLSEQLNSFGHMTTDFTSAAQSYLIEKGVELSNTKSGIISVAYSYMYKEAYTTALNDIHLLTAIVTIATLPLLFFVGKKKKAIKSS